MRDIYDLAVRELKESSDGSVKKEASDKTLVICGSKGVGKSTLVNSFLQKDEQLKPTLALEYSFGYLNKGSEKEIGHVYELGGGTWLSKLLSTVLTPATVTRSTLVVMVDLTSPSSIWTILDHLIATARSACENSLDSMGKLSTFKEMAADRFPKDHEDLKVQGLLRPFPIPFVIVGGKYDQFQAMEPEPRKNICRGLRFFANTYGATLLFYSNRQEQLVSRASNFFTSILFGSEFSRSPVFDPNKPLFIPVGSDSFQEIGPPPVSDQQMGFGRPSNPIIQGPEHLWKESLTSLFPQSDKEKKESETELPKNPVSDPQFAESIIDNLRKQKDVELERYRRASERKTRDLSKTGGEMEDIYN